MFQTFNFNKSSSIIQGLNKLNMLFIRKFANLHFIKIDLKPTYFYANIIRLKNKINKCNIMNSNIANNCLTISTKFTNKLQSLMNKIYKLSI